MHLTGKFKLGPETAGSKNGLSAPSFLILKCSIFQPILSTDIITRVSKLFQFWLGLLKFHVSVVVT